MASQISEATTITSPDEQNAATLVEGTDRRDRLVGTATNDTILGQGDDDRLNGGEGDDRLDGGLGRDTVFGGPGADTFVLQYSDTFDLIGDFVVGEDRVEVAIDDVAPRNLRVVDDGSGALLQAWLGGGFTTLANIAGAAGATVESLLQLDVPGDASTPSVLPVGGEVRSTVESGDDEDWFRVEVVAGTTYAVELGTAFSGEGQLSEPLLRLYDEGAVLIEERASSLGFPAIISFVAPEDGVVFVSAGGFETSTGAYVLRAAIDAIPADTTTTAVLSVDGAANGAVDFEGDEDWFRFDVEAGTTYVFDLRFDFTQLPPLLDPLLRLYDDTGGLIEDSGRPALTVRPTTIGFLAPEDGTVFVSAGGFEAATGTYVLRAALDIPGDITTTAALSGVGEVRSTVGFSGDEDWFRVEVVAGDTYRFDLRTDGSAPRPLTDPLFRLYDATGNLIGEDDNGGGGQEARLIHTVTSDGVLFASAGGFAGFGGSTGGYVLSVETTTVVQTASSEPEDGAVAEVFIA